MKLTINGKTIESAKELLELIVQDWFTFFIFIIIMAFLFTKLFIKFGRNKTKRNNNTSKDCPECIKQIITPIKFFSLYLLFLTIT